MTKQNDAANLILHSADVMRAMADKAGVTLSVSPYQPGWVDSDRIIQTLTNLLSNAKFFKRGSTVWLSAELVKK